MNTNNITQIKTSTIATKQIKIEIKIGIRESASLSPFLFNLIIDRIIETVRKVNYDYQMGNNLLLKTTLRDSI